MESHYAPAPHRPAARLTLSLSRRYPGTVKVVGGAAGKTKILYDDGDVEWTKLPEERWKRIYK